MAYSKIILAGGSGQIGPALTVFFKTLAKEIVILTRNPVPQKDKNVTQVYWDGKSAGAWTAELEGADFIVNLTGKSINCLHNDQNKSELVHSRIDSVLAIAKAIELAQNPPQLWIQFCGIDGYGYHDNKICDEKAAFNGEGFLPELSQQWENTFWESTQALVGLRKVSLRTSMVLAKHAGIYPKLKPLVRWWLGGRQGSGEQWVSWVHEADVCRLVDWIAQHKQITGAVNCTAPYPVSNADLMRTFRKAANVWLGLPAPTLAIKVGTRLAGVEPGLILDSRRAVPAAALESGFQFAFPKIRDAIKQIYERGRYRK